MAWTEERVEILKKLWGDGLSASQIAAQLGEVSRNAVIGKVHRLGLARRAPSSRSQVSVPRKTRRSRAGKANGPTYSTREKNVMKAQGRAPDIWNKAPVPQPVAPVPTKAVDELVIPLAERKTIATLEPCSCRWPIGDPEEDDFHFCGRRKLENAPYCEHHARIAYQPRQTRNLQAASRNAGAVVQLAPGKTSQASDAGGAQE